MKHRTTKSFIGKTAEAKKRQLANLKKRWDKYKGVVPKIKPGRNDIIIWAEKNFYIPETRQPIVLLPHEIDFLTELFCKEVKPNLAVLVLCQDC